jgi:uncharacterized membrane protein
MIMRPSFITTIRLSLRRTLVALPLYSIESFSAITPKALIRSVILFGITHYSPLTTHYA